MHMAITGALMSVYVTSVEGGGLEDTTPRCDVQLMSLVHVWRGVNYIKASKGLLASLSSFSPSAWSH